MQETVFMGLGGEKEARKLDYSRPKWIPIIVGNVGHTSHSINSATRRPVPTVESHCVEWNGIDPDYSMW
jgi:hypothetical protein